VHRVDFRGYGGGEGAFATEWGLIFEFEFWGSGRAGGIHFWGEGGTYSPITIILICILHSLTRMVGRGHNNSFYCLALRRVL
jgi:hypothetical protein